MADSTPTEEVLVIDGEEHKIDTDALSFEELNVLRRFVRELSGDPRMEIHQAVMQDLLPALVTVIKQRNDEFFTLAQAGTLKYSDIVKERPLRRPSAASKKKATASTGSTPGDSGTPE